ncbi:MAG: transposase family protein [Chloroflexota bacterium]
MVANVVLEAEGINTSARCPSCQTASSRVHERYTHRPIDLPWRGRKARRVVTVRRFRCVSNSCVRHTFAEDFGEALPRCARRTTEATDLLLDLALRAGGKEGARLADAAGLPVSADTPSPATRRTMPKGDGGVPIRILQTAAGAGSGVAQG